MVQKSPSELAEEFIESMGRLLRGMGAFFRKEMEKHGITWPQFHLLKSVEQKEGITVTELADLLMISPPTTSRMIDSLCRKDLLVKEKDAEDHRITRIRMTQKSERLLADLSEMQKDVTVELLEGYSIKEIGSSIRFLSSLSSRIAGASEERATSND